MLNHRAPISYAGAMAHAMSFDYQKTGNGPAPLLPPRHRLGLAVLVLAMLGATQPAAAQDRSVSELARRVLSAAQAGSFRSNREYCGTIGFNAAGHLVASHARRGGRDHCLPEDPPGAVMVVASFHTHAGFDPDADSEVPSVDDVLGDRYEGLHGYVATPGGRVWFIDGQAGTVRQLCGRGCLPTDPDFEPQVFGPVAQRYTLRALRRREAE
ncbi:MAG: DUF4329 domain-containing protein [Rhodobacteraceae bacterium]|nr:DUF4329 domain-containing protein [Paracoccaceae bacterium]